MGPGCAAVDPIVVTAPGLEKRLLSRTRGRPACRSGSVGSSRAGHSRMPAPIRTPVISPTPSGTSCGCTPSPTRRSRSTTTGSSSPVEVRRWATPGSRVRATASSGYAAPAGVRDRVAGPARRTRHGQGRGSFRAGPSGSASTNVTAGRWKPVRTVAWAVRGGLESRRQRAPNESMPAREDNRLSSWAGRGQLLERQHERVRSPLAVPLRLDR